MGLLIAAFLSVPFVGCTRAEDATSPASDVVTDTSDQCPDALWFHPGTATETEVADLYMCHADAPITSMCPLDQSGACMDFDSVLLTTPWYQQTGSAACYVVARCSDSGGSGDYDIISWTAGAGVCDGITTTYYFDTAGTMVSVRLLDGLLTDRIEDFCCTSEEGGVPAYKVIWGVVVQESSCDYYEPSDFTRPDSGVP